MEEAITLGKLNYYFISCPYRKILDITFWEVQMAIKIFHSKVLVIFAFFSFLFFLSSDALSQKSSSQESEVKPEVKEKVEKPKKSYTALYILGGLAVAGGVAYLLLTKSKKEEEVGNISITSEPEGAKVYLDGQDTGKRTNTTLTNIKVGTHQLKLELELYGKREGNVEVKKNYTTIVQAKLAPFKYEFVTKWGSYGSGDYQFIEPHGVAVDSSGNVYVADSFNHRIMKFRISTQTTFQVNISYSPIYGSFNLLTPPSQNEPKERRIEREKREKNELR